MSEDVELCLEVQVDPASKKILLNPDKCRSALLDVTVVKPKEVEAFGKSKTNTLRADEVRELITSLGKQRRNKQKYSDGFKEEDTIIKICKHGNGRGSYKSNIKFRQEERISPRSPVDDLERKDFIGITESVEPLFTEIRRSLKNVETRISNMQDINLMISEESTSSDYYSKRKSTRSTHLKKQSVYRVETEPNRLKSPLLCKNRIDPYLHAGDDISGKCLCENCGTVGLLTECQKHPLLTELRESPAPSNHRQAWNQQKKTRFNVSDIDSLKQKSCTDQSYVHQLTDRLKLIVSGLQEERTMPRDYFKRFFNKIVGNFTPRFSRAKSEEYFNNIEETKRASRKDKSTKQSETFQINRSTQAIRRSNRSVRNQQTQTKDDKSTMTEGEALYNGGLWRWGEEILQPGIDLKNKLATLLSDVLSKFVLIERCSPDITPTKKDASYGPETLKKFLKPMNIYNAQVHNTNEVLVEECGKISNHDFEHFHCLEEAPYATPTVKENPEVTAFKEKFTERKSKSVDVSYVNSKISLWKKESANLCKTESKLSEKKPSTMIAGREEFLKIISKAKQEQKDILWKNIWSQAKENSQTKNDIITIKIPLAKQEGKAGEEMLETDLTIREVEEILRGA